MLTLFTLHYRNKQTIILGNKVSVGGGGEGSMRVVPSNYGSTGQRLNDGFRCGRYADE